MSTAYGLQQGGGGTSHVDACRQGRGKTLILLWPSYMWMTPYGSDGLEMRI